jgi:hypothetical protein
MIYRIPEAGLIHNGINFYPRGDIHNGGFRLRWNNHVFFCRYSKLRRRWHFQHIKVN